MKNRQLITIIFTLLILFSGTCFAKDLDQINEYHITVEPRKDGSLDISYHVEWEVLEATLEEPVTWVTIGIPNANVDSVESSSKVVKTTKYYEDTGGAYVRIDFKKGYIAGDIIIFDFSIHQKDMYKIESQYCVYSFTPGWFDDIEVKDIQILWNSKDVSASNAVDTNSKNNYLKWSGKLKKGQKMEANVRYLKSAFPNLVEKKFVETKTTFSTSSTNKSTNSFSGSFQNLSKLVNTSFTLFFVAAGLIFLGTILSAFSGTGYRKHGGYAYDDDDYYYRDRSSRSYSSRSSSSSSHSCVSSCACACACAGGGRAGCSKKDFYGTNLRTNNIKKVLNK